MRKPDFFVVGAPRCGTTALNDYLGQHPEIFMPGIDRSMPMLSKGKELHFFGSDLPFKHRQVPSLQDYLAFFQHALRETRVGEASVFYLYSKLAAREIKEFCPSASIIIMLRNPVDMLYSLHSQLLSTRDEDVENFLDALDAECDRKKGLRIPEHNVGAHMLFYRDLARYTSQVKRYLDTFGCEKVHVIIYDDFARDTASAYKQTLRFLCVDDRFHADLEVVNANKVERAWLKRVLGRPPRAVLDLAHAIVPQHARDRINKRLWAFTVRFQQRPSLDPAFRRKLQAEFVPEIEALSELLGRDLTFWCQG